MNNKNLLKKSIFLGATLSLLSSVPSLSFAKEYYKWVDSKGSTHYTTTPPPNSAKKKGKVETYGWKNSTALAAATEASPAAQSAAKVAENAAKEKIANENKPIYAPQLPSEE